MEYKFKIMQKEDDQCFVIFNKLAGSLAIFDKWDEVLESTIRLSVYESNKLYDDEAAYPWGIDNHFDSLEKANEIMKLVKDREARAYISNKPPIFKDI